MSTDNLSYELEPGLSVRGVVVDAGGRALAGASVRLEARVTTTGGSDAAATDAAGRFELLGVHPSARFTARAQGHAPSTARPLVDADSDGAVELRLVLPGRGGELSGRIVDDRGAPVEGATLEVGGFQDGFDTDRWSIFEPVLSETDGTQSAPARPLRSRTDEHGRFDCAGIELGRVPIRVRPPQGRLACWSGHVEIDPDERAWLEVRLGTGVAVEGRVTDPSGTPAARITVSAWSNDAWLHVEARTDADGRYLLERIVPGRIELRANRERRRGLGTAEHQLELGHDTRVQWDAVLPGALAIAGRLVDERGEPLAGWLAEAYAGDQRITGGAPDRTDADGRFRFDGCPLEPHYVELRPPGDPWPHPPRAWREGVQPSGAELEFVADTRPSARVVGGVVDARGKALGEARIWATMIGPNRYVIAEAEDPSGAFAVEDLPPGRYRLTVTTPVAPSHVMGEHELAAGKTLDLGLIEIADPALLVVHVRGPGGDAPEGASVELRTEHGHKSPISIAFETRARARSGPAPAGRYSVLVRAPGCATAQRIVALVAGETRDLEVELVPGVECRFSFVVSGPEIPPGIAARLVDESGEFALLCFAPDPKRTGRMEFVELLTPGRYTLRAERVNPTLTGVLAFEVPLGSGPLRFSVLLSP